MERAFVCPGPGGFGMSIALSAIPGSSAGHRSCQPQQAAQAQPPGFTDAAYCTCGYHEQV